MRVGDLARVVPVTSYPGVGMAVKAWDTFPGEYGFHSYTWVGPGVAVLLENRDVYWRILAPGSGVVWVEHYRIGAI